MPISSLGMTGKSSSKGEFAAVFVFIIQQGGHHLCPCLGCRVLFNAYIAFANSGPLGELANEMRTVYQLHLYIKQQSLLCNRRVPAGRRAS
jgi:hypothetical protein